MQLIHTLLISVLSSCNTTLNNGNFTRLSIEEKGLTKGLLDDKEFVATKKGFYMEPSLIGKCFAVGFYVEPPEGQLKNPCTAFP